MTSVQSREWGQVRGTLEGTSIKIGRSANNDIAITENSVSRTHAILSPRGEAVEIEERQEKVRTIQRDGPGIQPARLT